MMAKASTWAEGARVDFALETSDKEGVSTAAIIIALRSFDSARYRRIPKRKACMCNALFLSFSPLLSLSHSILFFFLFFLLFDYIRETNERTRELTYRYKRAKPRIYFAYLNAAVHNMQSVHHRASRLPRAMYNKTYVSINTPSVGTCILHGVCIHYRCKWKKSLEKSAQNENPGKNFSEKNPGKKVTEKKIPG